MIIKPKIRELICVTAHPEGCRENVRKQIAYIEQQKPFAAPGNVLIIGCSTGYGLASRIALTYGAGAKTLGVMYEKEETRKKLGTAGWYNTKAFTEFATAAGYYAKTINGDAFSDEVKNQTIEYIKTELGQIDMVIYSVAAPRRNYQGKTYKSVLKTIGTEYESKSLNPANHCVESVRIPVASETEIADTVKVMGGEDWQLWIEKLAEAKVLSNNATTLAYSYIGSELMYPVYHQGTIGRAKRHLHQTAVGLKQKYPNLNAVVSVNKALVTQASAAIPGVPLYLSILMKVMNEHGCEEGCIEQMWRLFNDKRSSDGKWLTDENDLIRLDDFELDEQIQQEVRVGWHQVTTENLEQYADVERFWREFCRLYGFQVLGVDYCIEYYLPG